MTTQYVHIDGIPQLEAKLLASRILAKPLTHVLTDMGKLAQTTAKAGAPKHIKISRRTSSLSVAVRAIGADAATQEIGRKAGAKMPPKAVIAAWAQKKGIDAGLAFPIARAVARRGLKGRFYMKAARAAVEAALPARLLVMQLEIEQEFSA